MHENGPTSAAEDGSAVADGGHRSKVERVIAEYGLEGLGDELERRWLGEGREQQSLRDLADHFNERLLRRAMTVAGADPLQGESENLYRILTDDDVTQGMRTQARRSLEEAGVDPDALLEDFVSHQAIHTYLRKYRKVEQETPDDQREKRLEAIQRLESRLDAVTTRNVENLHATGRLDIGEFDVLTNVRIVCRDCGQQYSPAELFEQGGCECDAS
ncbi:rod-determining factor RdfA [Haloglomus litoreum]|uniref:rod-determining factor RdfA n=1 Tax=Haloglomus litoreum TaxID=3034026 RepID=UPI0023E7F999|nr:rod-determining factor RdfA [Haloglomus sp. DT116]